MITVNVDLPLDKLILTLTPEEQLKLRDQLNVLLAKEITSEVKEEIVQATNTFIRKVVKEREGICEICQTPFIKYIEKQKICTNPECKKEKQRRYNRKYFEIRQLQKVEPSSPNPTQHLHRVRVEKEIRDLFCKFCQKPFQTTRKNAKYCSKDCSYNANLQNIKRIQKEKAGKETVKKIEAIFKEPTKVKADIVVEGKKIGEMKEIRVPGVADIIPISKGHTKDRHPKKRKTRREFVKEKFNFEGDLNLSLIDAVKIKDLGEQRFCLRCGKEFTSTESLYCAQDCKNGMKASMEMAQKNLNSPRKTDVLYNGHKVCVFVNQKTRIFIHLNSSLTDLYEKYIPKKIVLKPAELIKEE